MQYIYSVHFAYDKQTKNYDNPICTQKIKLQAFEILLEFNFNSNVFLKYFLTTNIF